MLMHRAALTKFFAIVAALAVTLTVGVTSASADYPAKVKKQFTKECVSGATADGSKLTKKQAKSYCAAAIDCIESKVPLSKFRQIESEDEVLKNKKIKGCIKEAASEVAGDSSLSRS